MLHPIIAVKFLKNELLMMRKENMLLTPISRIVMIDCLHFTSRSRIFHLYGDITIAGEGL
jgi:hypothetical protein